MGVVYRARQSGLNRIVALKMILSGPFASETERQRFHAEAEAAARLDHPNILPIHEFGERDGRQFYVMRWVDGGALEVGMGPQKVARLLATVARAVHHAHQRGVLHRDLKPGNILLDHAGEPFIADFGLARRLDDQASLTATGSLLGTPAYMSPEQAAGVRAVTTAADIWSLGAVLYHQLSGRPPFLGPTVLEVMSRVREGFVTPPHHWHKAVDRDLETICLKCLRKEPAARYASAAELADDLERWLRREPIHARPISMVGRLQLLARRRPAITALSLLAILLLIAGLAGVLSQWQRAEHARDMAQHRLLQLHAEKAQRAVEAGDPMSTLPWMASALALEKSSSPRAQSYRHFLANTLRECVLPQEIWFFNREVRDIAFSSDGRHLAAATDEADLLVADLDADGRVVNEKQLRGGGNLLAFSPDGTRLFNAAERSPVKAIPNDGRVKVFALPGLRPLPELPVQRRLRAMDLSRDGRRLATASADGSVEIRNTATGKPVCPPLRCGAEMIGAEFNPAGTRLVTVCEDGTLRLWEVPSGRQRALVYSELFWRARFSPDGKNLLVVSRRANQAQLRDAESLAVTGPPLRHESYVSDAAFSPDGRSIATASLDRTARVWDARTGEPVTPPLPHANEVRCLAFSPDGKMLATGGLDSVARVWAAATGKPLTPWLRQGGEILSVKFSPSGRQLLTGSRDGTVRLWPLPVAPVAVRPLAGQPLPVWATTFSEDRKLAFAAGRDGGRGWRTDTWQPLTPELHADGIGHVRFSPDGQRLLTGGGDGLARIWKFDSAEPVASFAHSNSVTAIAWLPDSKRVFSTCRWGNFALWDARDGRLLKAFTNGVSDFPTLAVSPDGQWLAGSWDHRIATWKAATGDRVWFSDTPRGNIKILRFSPDSRLLVSGDDTGGVRVQRAATGEFAAPPMQHATIVREVCFSPDGQMFATASDDLTARIWSPFTGRPLTPSLKLPGGVGDIFFSPNGRWLVIANEQSFQVWDATCGVPISLIQTGDESLSGGAFLEDSRLGSVSESGTVREYRLETLTWPAVQTLPAMELLSGLKLDANGDLSPPPPAGTESSAARRQEAEATWHWLRAQFPSVTPRAR